MREGDSLEKAFIAADKRLYQQKQAKRPRLLLASRISSARKPIGFRTSRPANKYLIYVRLRTASCRQRAASDQSLLLPASDMIEKSTFRVSSDEEEKYLADAA